MAIDKLYLYGESYDKTVPLAEMAYKASPTPAWEVRHREWLSHPDGQVEVWELREDHNSGGLFGIFQAKGLEGGSVVWDIRWEGRGTTTALSLKVFETFISEAQELALTETPTVPPSLPFWRCKCGTGFYAPKGARADKYHDCSPGATCHNLGGEGHYRCPQQEDPPEVAPGEKKGCSCTTGCKSWDCDKV